jgi:hypothetical protein
VNSFDTAGARSGPYRAAARDAGDAPILVIARTEPSQIRAFISDKMLSGYKEFIR